MKPSLIFAALLPLASIPALPAAEPTFGNAPKNAAALAFAAGIADTHRKGGVAEAIRKLDSEASAFIRKAGATARYDFFAAMFEEAMGPQGLGHEDDAWKQALTAWCYHHCRTEGHSYWYERWTPIMHEVCFEAGNYGEARSVISYERQRRVEKGIDLDVASLKSVGPASPGFSPVHKRQLGRNQRIMIKDYRFLLAQAGQDIAEGKWLGGMETAALAANTAMGNYKWHQERNLGDSAIVMTDMTGHWRKATALTAEGYRFLDLPWLELQACRSLSTFNLKEGRGLHGVRMAEARALHLEYLTKSKGADVVTGLGKIRETLLSDAYRSPAQADQVSLMIADVRFREGKAERGWEIINGLRGKDTHSRDMRFLVDRAWCGHRVDAGLTDGVESELVALLRIAREGGLKQREIELYEIYARLLTALGRYEDALAIQREMIRLLRSFDVFTRLPAALHGLASLHARIGQRDRALADLEEARRLIESPRLPDGAKGRLRTMVSRPLPESPPATPAAPLPVDLQPRRAMMVPLEGLPARGLFTLTNPSGGPVSGNLRFQGKGLSFRPDALPMIGLDVAKAGGGETLSRAVTVPAGDFVAIDLSSDPQSAATAVSITWEPAQGKPQTAEWTTDKAEDGVSLAVTDAAEYLDNPFYMIPFYHLLQYRDAFARAVDFRVVASAPARIEFYDADDRLAWVDADGDGAFVSTGDIISQDMNRNGWGDITLNPDARETRFRMFVHPAAVVPGGELNLEIQMRDQGEWITHATDRLVFPKAAE
jgi:tetratricopeptide (TPR) repeat protein